MYEIGTLFFSSSLTNGTKAEYFSEPSFEWDRLVATVKKSMIDTWLFLWFLMSICRKSLDMQNSFTLKISRNRFKTDDHFFTGNVDWISVRMDSFICCHWDCFEQTFSVGVASVVSLTCLAWMSTKSLPSTEPHRSIEEAADASSSASPTSGKTMQKLTLRYKKIKYTS